jgi:hypothetical protein
MTDTPAQAPLPNQLRSLADQEAAVVLGLLEHAGKAGARTSEFWATVLAPPVTFVGTLFSGWAVAHGLSSNAVLQSVVPPLAASVTAAGAAFAASVYAKIRGDVKAQLIRLQAQPSPPS